MTSNPKPSALPLSAENVPNLFIEAPGTSRPASNSGTGMKRESPATNSDELDPPTKMQKANISSEDPKDGGNVRTTHRCNAPEPPTKVPRTVSTLQAVAATWDFINVVPTKRNPSGELEASTTGSGPTIPDEVPNDDGNEGAFGNMCSAEMLLVSTASKGMTAQKAVVQFSNIGKFVKDLEKQAKKASDENSRLRVQVKTIQQDSDKLMLKTTAHHKTQVNKLKNEVRHWKAEAEESEKARQINDLRKQHKAKDAELKKANKKYEGVMNAASGVVASQAVDLSKMIVKLNKVVQDCKRNVF